MSTLEEENLQGDCRCESNHKKAQEIKGDVPRKVAAEVLMKIFEMMLQSVPDRNSPHVPQPNLHLSLCGGGFFLLCVINGQHGHTQFSVFTNGR